MSDLTATYCTRLDEHLLTLANDAERKAFCQREFEKWEERFMQFQIAAAKNRLPPGHGTAWDYSETIAEIGKRVGKYKQEAVS